MNELRRHQWEQAMDLPVSASAVAFLVAYAWPILDPGLSDPWLNMCRWLVLGTWIMLAIDLGARVWLSQDRWGFVRSAPIDVLAVILPMLRPLRLLRLVALLSVLNRYAGNSMRGKVGVYLVGSVTLITFVASLAVLDAERGGVGDIQTFGDSLWWSFTTITTVGYGDLYPVTTTGRFIAVGLMFSGIAVLGVVTASFASWLIERVTEVNEESNEVTSRDLEALRQEIVGLRELLSNPSLGPNHYQQPPANPKL